MIQIRKATPADAADLIAYLLPVLAEDTFTLTRPEEFTSTVEEQAEWIEKMNSNPAKFLRVATVTDAEGKEKIIALMDFNNGHRIKNSHQGQFGITVAKDYRDQGIGTRLMKELLDWARANPKIEKVSLRVHEGNPRAIRVYEKVGFETEGRFAKDVKYADGTYADTLFMSIFTDS